MTPQQALQIVDQFTAQVNANREAHQQLQLAISVLNNEINKVEEKPKK
jgi:hypothetical protein